MSECRAVRFRSNEERLLLVRDNYVICIYNYLILDSTFSILSFIIHICIYFQASSNFDGGIYVTDVSNGHHAATLPSKGLQHTDKVLQVDWHPTLTEVLVSSGADGRVIFWKGVSAPARVNTSIY